MQADIRMAGVSELVPQVLHHDPEDRWLLETARPGTPVAVVERPEDRTAALHAALRALAELHLATCEHVFVGPIELAGWVHGPVATVAAVVRGPRAADGLAAVHDQLVEDLEDRTVTVGCCHGDTSVENVLVDEADAVTGLIDWESAGRGLPEVDAYLLLLSRRTEWEGGGCGDAMVDILSNGWRADELELLRSSPSWNSHLRPTTLLLLAWLSHVSANLTKTTRYRDNGWWLRSNVEQVLAAVADQAATPVVDEVDLAPADLGSAAALRVKARS